MQTVQSLSAAHKGLIASHLAQGHSEIRLPARQMVFCEGDDADELFEVVSGLVRIFRTTADGCTVIVGFAYPGRLLGLSKNEVYIYTTETVTPTVLRRCRKSFLLRLSQENPTLLSALWDMTHDELTAAQEQMMLLGVRSAVRRVASFLAMIAEVQDDESGLIRLPMTRQDIASFLCLTIETVSRSITKLREMGAIRASGAHDVRVTNLGLLERIVDGDEDMLMAA